MALSITELELQSTEYLPAREVMTSMGGGPRHIHTADGPSGNSFEGGILNGTNVQDVATDIGVRDVQVGLVNVLVHSVNGAIGVGTANEDSLTNM
jgi:hypothetical protein